MGLGFLKILSSQEISHYEISDLFSFVGYSSEPHICYLLWSLGGASGGDVIYHHFPCLALVFVPGVLWAIATKMPFLMTGVTLNFV